MSKGRSFSAEVAAEIVSLMKHMIDLPEPEDFLKNIRESKNYKSNASHFRKQMQIQSSKETMEDIIFEFDPNDIADVMFLDDLRHVGWIVTPIASHPNCYVIFARQSVVKAYRTQRTTIS